MTMLHRIHVIPCSQDVSADLEHVAGFAQYYELYIQACKKSDIGVCLNIC